jgi:hypothetical protein
MKRGRLLAGAGLLLWIAPAGAEMQWVPFLSAEFYGGRAAFSGDDVEGVNGSLLVAPGLKVNDRLSILPVASGAYRKTRDVQELAGGGFLTQETQERSLALKGIQSLGESWKGKAYVSYKQELVKETEDEDWNDGLFDYEKRSAGFEAEREGRRFRSLRFGLDYYVTRFPNFQSLSTREFGAEIETGRDVLDFNALDGSLGADVRIGPKSLVSGYALVSTRRFYDQAIVVRDGTFSVDKRRDAYGYLSAAYRRELPAVAVYRVNVESLAGVDVSYARLESDQNNYDAARTRFNPNFYDYGEIAAGPRLHFRFRQKLGLGLSFLYARRDYEDRPVQAADGTYRAGTIASDITTFRFTLSYPLLKGLDVRLQGAVQHADSNMDYETVYRYNYSSSHYFAGLSYQL